MGFIRFFEFNPPHSAPQHHFRSWQKKSLVTSPEPGSTPLAVDVARWLGRPPRFWQLVDGLGFLRLGEASDSHGW